MQGAAHMMMTLDITINVWLTHSYLRGMKCRRNLLKNFYGRYLDLILKYQRYVEDVMADSFTDQFHAQLVLLLGLSLFIN